MNLRLHGPYWLALIAAGVVALKVHDAGVRHTLLAKQRADSISAAYRADSAARALVDSAQAHRIAALQWSYDSAKQAIVVAPHVDLTTAKTLPDTVVLLKQQVAHDSVTQVSLFTALARADSLLAAKDARIAELVAANAAVHQQLSHEIMANAALQRDANPGFIRWTFKSPGRVAAVLLTGFVAAKTGAL